MQTRAVFPRVNLSYHRHRRTLTINRLEKERESSYLPLPSYKPGTLNSAQNPRRTAINSLSKAISASHRSPSLSINRTRERLPYWKTSKYDKRTKVYFTRTEQRVVSKGRNTKRGRYASDDVDRSAAWLCIMMRDSRHEDSVHTRRRARRRLTNALENL